MFFLLMILIQQISTLFSYTTFFFSCYGDHRDLHSFPTRRSSDRPDGRKVRVVRGAVELDRTDGWHASRIGLGRLRGPSAFLTRDPRLSSSRKSARPDQG